MKIAYATPYDSRDIRFWSGTGYFIAESLAQAGAEVHRLGPLAVLNNKSIRAKQILFEKVLGQRLVGEVDAGLLKGYAHQMEERLKDLHADLVFSPHAPPVARLNTKLPLVLWADCTFGGMVNFYPDYQKLAPGNLRDGHDAERRTLDRADLAIFACDWAAKTAVDLYQTDPKKIRIVPFGANILCDRTAADIERLIAARPKDRCNLLFIGRIWERKGGDTAIAVGEELRAMGIPVQLTLVGSQPEGRTLPDWVRPMGFISKRTPEGLKQFNDLLADSHFLILPSRAEAYGIVFCEASSFGIPSLATNVGGIPSVVRDGHNGQTFPLTAAPREWATYAAGLMKDYPTYTRLAKSAFTEYETRLNWRTAGHSVIQLLKELLAGK